MAESKSAEQVILDQEKRLIVGAGINSRDFAERIPALLEAGVRIHEFEGGLLHAKTTVVDRKIALVSSANLDRRSLFLNFEAGLLVYDEDFAGQLRFLQQRYLESSIEVGPDSPATNGVRRRIAQNAAALLSPLL